MRLQHNFHAYARKVTKVKKMSESRTGAGDQEFQILNVIQNVENIETRAPDIRVHSSCVSSKVIVCHGVTCHIICKMFMLTWHFQQ